MSKKTNLYLGKAGQLAVMSELLCRGWNVAMPEVDVGDDIFVVRDASGDLRRVQVKTASGKSKPTSFQAQYSVNLRQLERQVTPDLTYVFVVRRDGSWTHFLFIQRDTLHSFFESDKVGSVSGKNVVFTFLFQRGKVICGKQDFTHFLDNFEDFPLILH